MNPVQLLRKDIFKDLSQLMGGVFIAQLIPILLQPLLKRIFTVEEFGIFDLFARSAGILAIFFSLRYEKAIVICKEKKESVSIFIGIIILGFLMFILIELLLVLFGSISIELIKIPTKYTWVIYLIPLSALFFSIHSAAQFMFLRQKRFVAVSSLKIFRRSSEGIIQSGGGFFGSFWGLPVGETIGNFTAAFAGVIRLRKTIRKHLPANISSELWLNAKKYSEFPKYAFVPALLNTVVLSALTFQIFAKFSLSEVGFAELTTKMLLIPSALAGASLGRLILQRFSAAYHNQKSTRRLFFGLFLLTFLIAIPFFVLFFFWGPEIFGWVFGIEWTESGYYARILISGISLQFIISPFGQVLLAFHKIKINSFWEIGKFLIIVSLFFISFENIQNYLKLYNLLIILVYASQFMIIFYNLVKYERSIS